MPASAVQDYELEARQSRKRVSECVPGESVKRQSLSSAIYTGNHYDKSITKRMNIIFTSHT